MNAPPGPRMSSGCFMVRAPHNGLRGRLKPCATTRGRIAAKQATTKAVRRSPAVRTVHAGAPADTGRRRVAAVRRAGSSKAATATRSPRRKRARGRPTLAATVRLPSRPQFRAPDDSPETPDDSTSIPADSAAHPKYTLSDSALQGRSANFYQIVWERAARFGVLSASPGDDARYRGSSLPAS